MNKFKESEKAKRTCSNCVRKNCFVNRYCSPEWKTLLTKSKTRKGVNVMWRILVVSLIVVVMVITACGALSDSTVTPAEPEAELANPASKHCTDQGGKLETVSRR